MVGTNAGLSGMIVGGPSTTCHAMLERAANLPEYVPLMANGNLEDVDATNWDGIAEGYTPGGGFEGRSPVSGTLTFVVPDQMMAHSVEAPPGYAVAMSFSVGPGGPNTYTIKRDTRVLLPDEAQVQQMAQQNNQVLWLRDGIKYGETITVSTP